ncbi:MAG: DUF1425 domain-containing protein [Planctomycetes bacterium]|nr:DUF1425 domain-containing protein [Planctomycetota bacterium]
MKTRTLIALAVLSPLVMLAACQSSDPVKAPFTPGPDLLPTENYPKVVIELPLQQWVVASAPVVSTETGPMSVSVPIRLTSDLPSQFARTQYRFIFLDASGVPLRAQTDWKYMRLEPRNQVFLKGTSLDTTAKDWRCEIRSAR